ncbi:hypothetical protein GIY62_00655 [Burkholderia plantarii]|uniref:hypothetical protein n=1 Tax=Burkholderia plantarii TaxID=41899 RepID=UPI00272AEEB3|nr:hypothetical protein [Burkholderia plantarii]WLE59252.1 hypothetical protein GIY62_00655 [Burkholderia plantarii]
MKMAHVTFDVKCPVCGASSKVGFGVLADGQRERFWVACEIEDGGCDATFAVEATARIGLDVSVAPIEWKRVEV